MHEPNPKHDVVFEAVKAHVEPRDQVTRDAATQLRKPTFSCARALRRTPPTSH